MPTIVIPSHIRPQQVEDFPAEAPRTVKGAMHIRPGTMEVTPEELKHLQMKHAKALRGMYVLPEAPPATAETPPDVFAAPAFANAESAMDEDGSAPRKKSRG